MIDNDEAMVDGYKLYYVVRTYRFVIILLDDG